MSYNSLWLINKLKFISAGIELKANAVLNLHEQILVFFTTGQGVNETNDEYLVRLNAHCRTLEMLGGEHVFAVPN